LFFKYYYLFNKKMLIEKTSGRLSLIKTKEQVLSSYRDNSPATKQLQLKNSVNMALTTRNKVDDCEDENNRYCECGGIFFKGVYNEKEIIVCEKCLKVKYLKSKIKKHSMRKSLDCKNDNLRKIVLNQNVPVLKKHKLAGKIYKKPIPQKLNIDIVSNTQKNFVNINDYKKNNLNTNYLNDNINTFCIEENQMKNINNKDVKKRQKKRFLNSVPDFRTLLKNFYSNTVVFKNEEKENLEEEKSNSISITDDLNINAFKLIKLIGNGSYANIYLVQENKTKKKYAFKKIIVDGEREVEKIKNEIEILKVLCELDNDSKKSILEIYKYCIKKLDITSYCFYFLMPLAKTDWLKQIEDENMIYTEEKLIEILINLSKALSIMQYKNIAHRDIKPQNILIMDNGDYKIADFDESIFVKKAYNFFEIKGTEMFMCPLLHNCIFSGCKKIKINVYKSDIYSLGLCFVYAITKNLDLLNDIRNCSNDNKNKNDIFNCINDHVEYSEEFKNLIMKMIAFNEKERLDSIELYSIVKKNYLEC